jgi:hypothetical protein
MKFGVFYELQLARPRGVDSEWELYHDALAQLELADGLGYDHAWVVEHHFLEEYSHSSAPEVFLGAASQRTKRMRLGHGICESLELFAREVMPEFHASVPAHEEWKAAVLAGDIELEEIDTEPFRQRCGAKAVTV